MQYRCVRRTPGMTSRVLQVSVCETDACFTYAWHDEGWGECSVDIHETCGVGVQTRRSVCVRNDDVRVNDVLCGDASGNVAKHQSISNNSISVQNIDSVIVELRCVWLQNDLARTHRAASRVLETASCRSGVNGGHAIATAGTRWAVATRLVMSMGAMLS